MKKFLFTAFVALGSLGVFSAYAANQEPVEGCNEPVPCEQTAPCNPAPCDTVPCNPAPCAPGC